MELILPPDLEARLHQRASLQGRDSQALVREAVERFLGDDEWFLRAVKEGLAAADRGDFVERDEIGRLIDTRYAV